MLKVGLTGGIGSGKTTVAALFAQLDTPIIDADLIARQLVEPGQPALGLIQSTFGRQVINTDGSLNRTALRTLVFADALLKKQLEAILHPLILNAMKSATDVLKTPYSIICIPLLFETGLNAWVDRILVVDCPIETQITRVKQRDHLDEDTICRIIASQTPRAIRNAQADDLIDNSTANSQLAEHVKKLHNLYLSLSVR